MKVLVTGSRTWCYADLMSRILHQMEPTLIVHGGARGADTMAGIWAKSKEIPVIVYYPDWKLYGKSAGMIRNEEMLNHIKPDAVVAFWDGTSRGTKHMIDFARKRGYVVRVIVPPVSP